METGQDSSSPLAVRVLHCFSANKNIKEIVSTKKPSADDISCLHGIRVLSFIGLILVHTGEEIYRRRMYNKKIMSQVFYKISSSCVTYLIFAI